MTIATSLVQLARSYTHDKVRVGSRVGDISDPNINVVRIKRQGARLPVAPLRKLVDENPTYHAKAVVATKYPEVDVSERLLGNSFQGNPVRDFLLEDIASVVGKFRDELGYDEVNVKLEVVRQTRCPKWHADHVGVRCLCTYVGEGTLYVENRHAKRSWQWHEGMLWPTVQSVNEEQAQQADAGDLLFLKGHKWEGKFLGLGAIHRSPDMQPDSQDDARLLLTVDDALPKPCDCGVQHG